jgi:tRNA-specific 2-thiouridylase
MVDQPISSLPRANLLNGRKKPRVVVAMSGGVDSSVAAALLVQQGYDVIGVMMRLWSEPDDGSSARHNRCCTPDQMADARQVASQLNIPFYVLDVQEYFYQAVVQSFIDEHALGRTPNPCVACNREIRFDYLLDQSIALDSDYLATGHYARIRQTPSGYELLEAHDKSKDQSYALFVLGQYQLERILFPIGELTKKEVRELATSFDLPVASKDDSMDLCFIASGDYRQFLNKHASNVFPLGPIVRTSGQVIGEHNGLRNYTIGQRKGLGISAGEPMYVLVKDIENNEVVVGTREELAVRSLNVSNVTWISGIKPVESIETTVKIRYKSTPVLALVTPHSDKEVKVDFREAVFGVTAGQAAVFYKGEKCIGGGIISDNPVK